MPYARTSTSLPQTVLQLRRPDTANSHADPTTTALAMERHPHPPQQDGILDPRLSSAPSLPPLGHPDTPQRPAAGAPPAPPFAATPSDSQGGYQSHSTPYYHSQTPQQHSGPQSVGGSAQPSPANNPIYQQFQEAAVSPNHGDEQEDDAKRPRACEACRGLKVRCDQDPSHPEQPCRRCAKAGRQCVITQPTRKRQKKSDTRVAELEKKLDALTAALQQSQQGGAVPYRPQPPLDPAVQPGLDPRASYDGAIGTFPPP